MADVLPPTVEALIHLICLVHKQPPLPFTTRRQLARLGEIESMAILREIDTRGVSKTFDDSVQMILRGKSPSQSQSPSTAPLYSSSSSTFTSPQRQQQQQLSGSPKPTWLMMHTRVGQFSQSSASTPVKRLRLSPPPSPPQQLARSLSPTLLMTDARDGDLDLQWVVRRKLEDDFRDPPAATMEHLKELEFRKAFLILSYLRGKKLKDYMNMTADQIRELRSLPMRKFEELVWSAIGMSCIGDETQRIKSDDWNPKRPHVYQCTVDHNHHDNYDTGLSYEFKGPYFTNMRNFLHATLGDENVLLVKFSDKGNKDKSIPKCNDRCYAKYATDIIKDGIHVGPHRFHFFVFKDGQKEEKKKDSTTSPVKCYFIRLDGNMKFKSIREARSFFMHLDSLPNLSKYMARFSLILSKTIKLDVDLADVFVDRADDILCSDEEGKIVYDKKGKPLIYTDGTGFISEDLARLCPIVTQGRCLDSDIGEPLLMQLRLFHKGKAIKGTLLLNKKLSPKTIVFRQSMVKVDADLNLSHKATANSMEIVNTSRRPKPAELSRNLIALLSYGGVPKDFFMDLVGKALDDALVFKRRAAARANFIYPAASFPYEKEMLLSGIPFEESYLKFRLPNLMTDEKKRLRGGKIPLPESYYLMGTTDPSGVLKNGEVCIILDNGQVSGKVLVYRNPGLHFGDIHILEAVYLKEMEGYVGSSKFAIFFPIHGPRSLADEMAGGDYDGDMFFVSRNPQLLESFLQSEPWESSSLSASQCEKPSEIPSKMSDELLETELFKLFLATRFNASSTAGMAAESWLAMMDRLLIAEFDGTIDVNKCALKKNILSVIDIYYDALDAPKSGAKVELPPKLKMDRFPHYMEKPDYRSYKSTSILGLIYDEVRKYEARDDMPISEIVKLPCFAGQVLPHLIEKWEKEYSLYRIEMARCCSKEVGKNIAADEINEKYRKIFYGPTGDFCTSEKKQEELFDEARAIYQVVYEYAEQRRRSAANDPEKVRKAINLCAFAWKVAGSALCALYMSSRGEKPLLCSESAFKEMFGQTNNSAK
ncbi:unnamed protein product [Linum tenue]|uniref:RNA-dependent RNA polymerase n=1 Tax=Linum tenue TaxID=586396 RepID=A0AAV0QH18_9ROSI|nr:unnamed protein product [Linum tenue]